MAGVFKIDYQDPRYEIIKCLLYAVAICLGSSRFTRQFTRQKTAVCSQLSVLILGNWSRGLTTVQLPTTYCKTPHAATAMSCMSVSSKISRYHEEY